MNALVLGASGHLGSAILRELLARGYSVTAISRRREPPSNLQGLPVRYMVGDLDTQGNLEQWIPGHELVVDAAAPYPLTLADDLSAGKQRTMSLLAAVEAAGVILAYVSSFTTLKKWRGDLWNWPAQLARWLHPYFEIKQWIEEQVLDAARRGVRTVIVNPTMCFGPWDVHRRELCLIPRLLTGQVPAVPLHNLNVLDVREVASGLVSAVEARLYGRPMLFSGHNVSGDLLFRWICEIGGASPPPLSGPLWAGAFGGYWLEAIFRAGRASPPFDSLAAMVAYQHEWMPPSRALRDLGITIRPLYETLVDSVEWYREIEYC